jgi:putative flippase GtrA
MATVLASKIKQLYISPKFREFVRFAIVGLIATGIHYGIYYLLNLFINVNVAYTIGYLVSWFVNLYLTAYFTFKSTLSFKKGVGFAASHLVNYVLHMLFLNLFLAFGVSEEIAPLFVFAIVIPINFLLVRFVFKSKQFKSQEE